MTAPPANAATADPATAVGLAEPVLDAQAAFRAALEAMSRPGRPVDVATAADAADELPAAMAALALALVDGDTPVWLDGRLAAGTVPAFLRFHCGCPLVAEPAAARFALIADPAAMPPLDAFAVGRDQFPEESATLIVKVAELTTDGGPFTLRGPGIRDSVKAGIVGVMYESLCQVMRGGYSKWVAEIHRRRTPQCRNLRRSRVYRVRFG